MLSETLFWIFSFGIIVSSLFVIRSRTAIYSVLSLVVSMCLTAGLFILLKAYLVATIQVIVYAGAILVLFLFIVMLLDIKELVLPHEGFRLSKLVAFLCGAAFFGIALCVIRFVKVSKTGYLEGTPESIGRLLFTRHVLPFELTSVLLLAAVLSVVVLAKRDSA